jgi:hypothetical protein
VAFWRIENTVKCHHALILLGNGKPESLNDKHDVKGRKILFDYCFNYEIPLAQGIWMSFFDTEEAHAVKLAYAANGGGRAALKVTPTSLNL